MTKPINDHDPTLLPSESAEQWNEQGWETEPTPVHTAAKLATTLSIRFDPEHASLLRRAAQMAGLTKSEFVRKATLEPAQHVTTRAPSPAIAGPHQL